MAAPQITWYPAHVVPSALPVVPRSYHEFYRAPRLRWWKPLAALGLFAVVEVAVVLLVTLAGYTVEVVAGRITPAEAMAGRITPVLFLANNIGLALAIPLAIGAHALVYRQRPGSWPSACRSSSPGWPWSCSCSAASMNCTRGRRHGS
jgi:hypothetical protein